MLRHTVPRPLSTTFLTFLEVIPSITVLSDNQLLRQSSGGAAARGVVKAAAVINVGRGREWLGGRTLLRRGG
jgi:hypothetical protein